MNNDLLLTIDYGNTNPHVGFFKNQSLKKCIPLKKIKFWPKSEDALLVLSKVGKVEKNFFKKKGAFFDLSELRSGDHFLDMPINYNQELGEDRLYQAYYAFHHFLNLDIDQVILIDSGTFTTIDVINEKGFEGGLILPGLSLLKKTYERGEKLKKSVKGLSDSASSFGLGHSTQGSIQCALSSMLEGSIKRAQGDTDKKNLFILTGGKAENFYDLVGPNLLTKRLQLIPNLIHFSLEYIFRSTALI